MLSFFRNRREPQPAPPPATNLSDSWLLANGPSPAPSPQRRPHSSLSGPRRLTSLVSALNDDCPWTATVTPHEMIEWLRSECDEVKEEVCAMEAIKDVR